MAVTTSTPGAPAPSSAAVREKPEAPPAGEMRVVMLAHISGTRNGAEWPRVGEDMVVPAAEANDLIRNFLAKPAAEPEEVAVVLEPEPERAVEPEPEEAAIQDNKPPEQAVVPRARSARPARKRSQQKGK